MVFLVSLILVIFFTALLHKPLTKHPVIFYLIALAMVSIYLYAHFFTVPVWLWRYFLIGVQRCSIALAFFTIVMYTSVFTSDSKLYAVLHPMRRQLSILGSIFTCGHIVAYTIAFAPRFVASPLNMNLNLAFSLAVSLIITVLLVILTFTSFVVVRKRMSNNTWLKIQKLAYPFYGLIYLHLILVLAPSAFQGSTGTWISLFVYTVLFGSYVRLRSKRGHTKASITYANPQLGAEG